jgi:N-carbamoyl-L-amino-acid hydrolase
MLTIDEAQFRESFETYSAIGATDDGGLHRLALGEADIEAREQFAADLAALGLDVRVDPVGNTFARRAGTDPEAAPVVIGSHLDSQPYGGRYDGQLGVLTALETLRTLDDEDVRTDRPIEIVNWTNEEGSRFQHAMLGSAVFAGETSLEEALALTDSDGTRLGDALEQAGYDGVDGVGPDEIASYLELHVEQGPTLADHGTSVGIVDGVVGISWLRVTITGDADHAGPTPMHTRRDAMATAADAVSEITTLPTRLSSDAVTTVGEFRVEPDSINVIPDRAVFTVDLRAGDDAVRADGVDRIEREVATACDRHGTTYEIESVWSTDAIDFSPAVRRTLDDVATRSTSRFEHLVSGAGHDATYINELAPTGMLFVPSVDGITHNEAEYTPWEDCVAGATVFARAVQALATQ